MVGWLVEGKSWRVAGSVVKMGRSQVGVIPWTSGKRWTAGDGRRECCRMGRGGIPRTSGRGEWLSDELGISRTQGNHGNHLLEWDMRR